MSESDRYKRKADELLEKAAATDTAERAALLEQAVRWHSLALEACNRDAQRPAAAPDPRRAKDGG